ncbi:unnamed protein product [Mytilus coruscus]|uniref:Uncharacterized protein n=1 Tax=Mytilus coruscus TaxID=42192 RepID=A0A6J8DYM6_MYTCO|nr:unnamed protein product [Mytilus coruscus]
MLAELNILQACVNETIIKCNTLELKHKELFGESAMRAGRSVGGLLKKKISYNKKKAMKRDVQRLKDQCQYIAENLCPSFNLDNDQINMNDANKIKDIVETSLREQTNNINVDLINTIGVKALFILLRKQLFTCEAKFIILDNLGSLVETRYWTCFNSVYESGVNGENQDVEMDESECEEEKCCCDRIRITSKMHELACKKSM